MGRFVRRCDHAARCDRTPRSRRPTVVVAPGGAAESCRVFPLGAVRKPALAISLLCSKHVGVVFKLFGFLVNIWQNTRSGSQEKLRKLNHLVGFQSHLEIPNVQEKTI